MVVKYFLDATKFIYVIVLNIFCALSLFLFETKHVLKLMQTIFMVFDLKMLTIKNTALAVEYRLSNYTRVIKLGQI